MTVQTITIGPGTLTLGESGTLQQFDKLSERWGLWAVLIARLLPFVPFVPKLSVSQVFCGSFVLIQNIPVRIFSELPVKQKFLQIYHPLQKQLSLQPFFPAARD